jgi:hypothetical protein
MTFRQYITKGGEVIELSDDDSVDRKKVQTFYWC